MITKSSFTIVPDISSNFDRSLKVETDGQKKGYHATHFPGIGVNPLVDK